VSQPRARRARAVPCHAVSVPAPVGMHGRRLCLWGGAPAAPPCRRRPDCSAPFLSPLLCCLVVNRCGEPVECVRVGRGRACHCGGRVRRGRPRLCGARRAAPHAPRPDQQLADQYWRRRPCAQSAVQRCAAVSRGVLALDIQQCLPRRSLAKHEHSSGSFSVVGALKCNARPSLGSRLDLVHLSRGNGAAHSARAAGAQRAAGRLALGGAVLCARAGGRAYATAGGGSGRGARGLVHAPA
jgi:hypothetical protein